ncbi:hypothetical protein [Paenibacillus qinlingensis]|uniref:hypothetical protein n=1 Tax=Paenibacillus qinlingensis TaxID=1837343 RepID=UPI0015649833|nr:hypothetical protein [Paenibacillus qinlingensis]NQX63683.1 hypothetical protein [Paenibacillus qinlingensis]
MFKQLNNLFKQPHFNRSEVVVVQMIVSQVWSVQRTQITNQVMLIYSMQVHVVMTDEVITLTRNDS